MVLNTLTVHVPNTLSLCAIDTTNAAADPSFC